MGRPTWLLVAAVAVLGASDRVPSQEKAPAEKAPVVGQLQFVETVGGEALEAVNCAAFSPDGKFLYVSAWQASAIVVYRRDADTGALTRVQTMQTQRDLDGVTCVCLSPDGKLAAGTAFQSKSVMLMERDPETGRLRRLDTAREGEKGVEGLNWAIDGAFSPDSKFLYVCDPKGPGRGGTDDEVGAVTAFRVTANGKLKWIEANVGEDACFDGARNIEFHPTKKLAFVGSSDAGALVMLDWDDQTGKTTVRQVIRDEEGAATALAGAMEATCSPDGRFVYVSSGRFKGDQAVSVFRLTDDDQLEFVQELVSGASPLKNLGGTNAIRVSPDGLSVYAAGTTSHSLACFSRDPETGRLTVIETLADDPADGRLTGAAGVAISYDGKHLYVTAEDHDSVSIFRRVLK